MPNETNQQYDFKKSKIFCGNFPDKDTLLQDLFPQVDVSDPRSPEYLRELVRPVIQWSILVFQIIVMLILSASIFIVVKYGGTGFWTAVLSATVFALGYCIVRLKRIILCFVHLYQHFAPDYIRNRCRYEPSCSEYMILAVSKYGVFKGTYKGIQRIRSCSHHGGGYDWP